jgi:hypothetical protein
MDLPVVPFVSAVHVVEDIRVDHCVIQSGVEISRLVRRAAGNLYLRKLLVPRGLCIGTNLVEIPTGKLGFEILAGTFDRDERTATLSNSWCSSLGVNAKNASRILSPLVDPRRFRRMTAGEFGNEDIEFGSLPKMDERR